MMKPAVTAALLLSSLAWLAPLSCALAAEAATPAASAAAAATPTATPEVPPITFLDSTLFDNMLAKELSAGKGTVEVAVSGKMSLNSIPARVDKWITAVAEKGEVTLQPQDASLKPKFVFALIPVVYSFLKQANSERSVNNANDYNASVLYHVDRATGESVIDKIVFVRKKTK